MPHVGPEKRRFGKKEVLCLLCMAVAILCGACKGKISPGSVEPKRQEVSGVTITTVAFSPVDAFYEASGTVKARNIGVISSRLMGTVKKVVVKEGDTVKAGDTLVFIDDRDVAQKKAAAEAGYKEAEKALEVSRNNRALADVTFQRYSKLFEEKVISRQEFDQMETGKKVADIEYERAQQAVERARAMQEEARVWHGFARIRAPYPGVVTAKKIDEGSMATPGTTLMVVEDTSQFKVEVAVDEKLFRNLSIGTEVDVLLESPRETRRGTVSRMAPAVDPTTRTFNLEVTISGTALKSGLFAKVLIPGGKKEAILVPGKAVVRKGQLTGVYSVDGKGVIAYSLVRTGKPYGEQVEVLSGLRSGDRIIVEGVEKAVDGGMVKK
jgi:RND family efflux transporter MFP subunit